MPSFVGIFLCVGVFAACMSCADTHLNCAAANIISDIIDPDGKIEPKKSVKYAKIATAIAGTISILCAIFADYIYALGTYGYTICGGVLIPIFVVGLLMKGKMKVRSAQIGITIGFVVALAFEIVPNLSAIFGGGVIPAIVATTLGICIPNVVIKDK